MNENRFLFFSDGLSIEKAKDKEGNEVMRLGGIASTMDKDADGEYLDPNGFDVSYLKTKGVVNWHHGSKTNPDAIIGEPSKVELTEKGLYIEADIYPGSKMGRSVYALAQTLQKNSKTRRLGFSIEGKALERNPLDNSRITKAAITGVAITHMPKNPNTFANVIKGHLVEDEDDEEEEDTEEKACDTSSASPLMKEHVDGENKKLTKGVVFDRIFSEFTDIDINKARKVYSLIQHLATMEKRTAPTDADIEKAFAAFGIQDKAPEADIDTLIQKGRTFIEGGGSVDELEKSMLLDGVEDDMIFQTIEELTKGEESEDEDEDEEEEEVKKGDDEEEEEEADEDDGKEKGAEIFKPKKKGEDMKKSMADDDIIKAITNLSNSNRQVAKATGTVLKKILSDNEVIMKANVDLTERLNQIEGTSVGRKSAPHAKAIEKSFEGGQPNDGTVQVSKTRNRGMMLDILEKSAMTPMEKGISNKPDPMFEKALGVFEASGQIGDHIVRELRSKNIVVVD